MTVCKKTGTLAGRSKSLLLTRLAEGGHTDKRRRNSNRDSAPRTTVRSKTKQLSTSMPAALAPLDTYASTEIGRQADVADGSHVLVVCQVLRLTVYAQPRQ